MKDDAGEMIVNRKWWVSLSRQYGLRQAVADYGLCLQDIVSRLPRSQKRRLTPLLANAGVALAECVGKAATSESAADKAHVLDEALQHLSETTTCLRAIELGGYLPPLPFCSAADMQPVYDCGEKLAFALRNLRRTLPVGETQIEVNEPETEDGGLAPDDE